MAKANERMCNPISMAEVQRRWAAIRAHMPTAGIDALVTQGANNLSGSGGYSRWFTGMAASSSQPHTVIFPREGLMTLVSHGSFNEETRFEGTNPEYPGIGRRLSTPSFPAVVYTGRYDAEILARELKQSGFRTVGLVGANSMYHGPISRLKELLAEITFIDATEMCDPIIAVKSAEEIGFIRRAAAMQDEVLAKVREHIRPGRKDFEVMAYGQYVGQLLGSETGYFLGCSAPPGKPVGHRTRAHQGRELRKGDIFLFQVETTGPGGFFAHLARIFVLGKAPQELVDMFGAMVEAQEHTVKLLKPGVACRDVFEEYNAYMHARGLPEETRLHCHGQGYHSVERPLIRSDETMSIAANMNIGIHPSFANKRMFVTVCDNFLTCSDGSVERLHRTPREIVEL